MKEINELVFEEDSALELIKKWVQTSNNKNGSVLLSPNKSIAEHTLLKLQITNKSTLGAVIYHTGGVLFQKGWLRFLGSGNNSFRRTISTWNEQCGLENAMLIADDILGGFFVLNGGYFEYGVGDVFYLAPDTLEWEWLDMSYAEFFHWACTGNLNEFYQSFLWNGWERELDNLNGDQGISFYPFLWSAEGKNVEKNSRTIVSIKELWNITNEFRKQFNFEKL